MEDINQRCRGKKSIETFSSSFPTVIIILNLIKLLFHEYSTRLSLMHPSFRITKMFLKVIPGIIGTSFRLSALVHYVLDEALHNARAISA